MAVQDTQLETTLGMSLDSYEVNHLVCCRESWDVALCGIRGDKINITSGFICAMCLEEVERLRPGMLASGAFVCPLDGSACPPDDEIDDRIRRATGWTGPR